MRTTTKTSGTAHRAGHSGRRAGWPILHVNITDNEGKVVADVDAASTADGLAYFLTSRRIDPEATEASIKRAVGDGMRKVGDRETIVVTTRTWDGQFLDEYKAEVH